MIKNPLTIATCIILTLAGAYLFFTYSTPAGVTPQSKSAEAVAWIGLATGIVSLLTAAIGLIQKLIEIRAK